MDFRDDRDALVSPTSEYASLNDSQLRSAIRFAEAHLRSVEEDHDALRRAYRDEIGVMRRHLVDRLLVRIFVRARPSSEQQRSELRRRFERHAMPSVEVASLVRAASKGRTDRLDALSEIEATALLLRLEPGA
jgi:tRNA C32,U32 (ribose-2'-O)-methylase TrmJ